MSDEIKTALELHASADEASFSRMDDRFNHLLDKMDDNHQALLVAVTEMKAANASMGMKSGVITSSVLLAFFEAVKQLFLK